MKRPCIVCAKTWKTQVKEQREPCPHYVGKHVYGCRHNCEGTGRPGPHDPDETIVILDPEDPDPIEEIIWDEGEIITSRVELFEKIKATKFRKVAPVPKVKPTAWRMTHNGRPYLPKTQHFEFWLFLHQDLDGTWSVGEKPASKEAAPGGDMTAKRIAHGLGLAAAKQVANDNHPTGGKAPRPLVGLPSEGQLKVLQRNGVEIPQGCSKQAASDLLSDLFATRALDR